MAKKPTKKELAAQEAAAKAEAEAQAQQAQQGPMLSVLAQYTKDQSFENPTAPDSLRSGLPAPEIQIGIEIGRQMLEGDNVEVTLMLKAEARRGDQIACAPDYGRDDTKWWLPTHHVGAARLCRNVPRGNDAPRCRAAHKLK